jgi:hypothetical protein
MLSVLELCFVALAVARRWGETGIQRLEVAKIYAVNQIVIVQYQRQS